jgi:HEAT repeat protein
MKNFSGMGSETVTGTKKNYSPPYVRMIPLPFLRITALPILLGCLASCQPMPPHSDFISTGALPTPPYAELSSHQLSFVDDCQVSCSTATIEETVASIEKLHAQPNRSYLRGHLEELASQLFQKLTTSKEPDAVMMTLLAATSCHHPLSRSISRELIRAEHPLIQLAAVQALSSLNTADADYILIEALRSDYPIVRLEAGWRIACKRSKDAFFHIDALSYKLPDLFLPYMPELFAIEGSPGSLHRLRQLLFNPNEEVVIEALVAIGRHKIVSATSLIESMEPHSPAVVEALAFALRISDSDKAREKLRKLAIHSDHCVKIQAALSLVFLGETGYQAIVEDLAQQGDVFAIAAFGECPAQDWTFPVCDQSRQAQVNLAMSLLRQKDPSCLSEIKNLLFLPEDYMLYESPSIGHSLSYWDIIPIDAFEKAMWPTMREQSLAAKEILLIRTLELNGNAFEEISATVFAEKLVDLYPCLLQLLENQRSEATIHLLEQEANRVGAPYNRAYATLALVHLGIETDETALPGILDFTREKEDQSWRPPLPWISFHHSDDRNTQQQAAVTAKLYIETIQTLAEQGTPASIDILTKELKRTPKKYLAFVTAALLQATM